MSDQRKTLIDYVGPSIGWSIRIITPFLILFGLSMYYDIGWIEIEKFLFMIIDKISF